MEQDLFDLHDRSFPRDGPGETANIDRLSLRFNYETGVAIQDENFAADMERIFAADSDNCRYLTQEEWGRRHPAARFAETVLVPLRPFL